MIIAIIFMIIWWRCSAAEEKEKQNHLQKEEQRDEKLDALYGKFILGISGSGQPESGSGTTIAYLSGIVNSVSTVHGTISYPGQDAGLEPSNEMKKNV